MLGTWRRSGRGRLRAAALVVGGLVCGLGGGSAALAQTPAEAQCFNSVQGRVNWGGGTRWNPQNVRSLCQGVRNSTTTRNRIACFRALVAEGVPWGRAIPRCRAQFSGGGGPVGGARRIDCPIRQARTEMVTPLPNGWWQTPQVGNLQNTRIAAIGGTPTLVCEYRAYSGSVSVMLKQPPNLSCRPRPGGFDCAPR